jgi:hypothetical protein
MIDFCAKWNLIAQCLYANVWEGTNQHLTSYRFRLRGCIQKFPDWVDNEINNNNNKHSLRSKTKCYGGKSH